jgi:hypothetical protein
MKLSRLFNYALISETAWRPMEQKDFERIYLAKSVPAFSVGLRNIKGNLSQHST